MIVIEKQQSQHDYNQQTIRQLVKVVYFLSLEKIKIYNFVLSISLPFMVQTIIIESIFCSQLIFIPSCFQHIVIALNVIH